MTRPRPQRASRPPIFHWLAWLSGTLVMSFGVTAVGIVYYLDSPALQPYRDLILWAGVLVVMTASGYVIGRVGRRIGFWECAMALSVVAAIVAVHLFKGWHILLDFGPGTTESYLDFLAPSAPGARYLGPLWDRMIALMAFCGFLLSISGGSLAFLFSSNRGRLNSNTELERMISWRHLTAHRKGLISVTATVAVIGIALGVAALVAVTAVMSGYQEDIQAKILSTNAHLVIQKYGIDFTEHQEIADKALKIDGIIAGTPFTFNEAMLSANDRAFGVLIKGIVPQSAASVTGIGGNVCLEVSKDGHCVKAPERGSELLEQKLASRDGVPSLIVGSELFKKLSVPVGTSVSLTTPVGIAGARGNAPKRLEFHLAGAFRSGMHEFDARLIYLEIGASQRLMGLGKAVNGVEFRVQTPENVERLANQALRAVGHYPYRSLDWRELNASIFTALKLQKIVMFLVLAFIVVVASFNIASTLFMAVVEKAREIGVLKSMGAHDASVMKIFVLEGWIVGGAGTGIGIALGLLVCGIIAQMQIGIAADVYMVESLKVRVQPLEVLLTALAALAISHLATLYPALKAARQRPVDAMRYE